MKQRYFNLYHVKAFDPIKILTQNDFNVVAKKMAQNGRKMAIYELYISNFFLTKLKIKGKETNCDLWHSF